MDVATANPASTDTLVGGVENLKINSQAKAVREPTSVDECRQRLEKAIKSKGLQQFYPEVTNELAERAANLVNELRDKKQCSWEMANQFAILALYDLAILIDDSDSMVYDQKGARIKTLQKILNAIADIYNLAREQGILTVRFLNATKGKKNVTAKTVKTVIKGHDYGGVTRIGTELKKKILDKFVLGVDMKKPLLIMVITDGAAEGESTNLLESVIKNCIYELSKEGGTAKGPNSVAFQFSRVGDDDGAMELLKKLDDDKEVGIYVDCLPMTNRLEDLGEKPERKWVLMSKLLLGAISDYWDGADEEIDDETKGTLDPKANTNDDSDEEDEEVDGSDEEDEE
ncbi:hypothetical protein Q9L58_001777 [Maublancomyces gigas]|uniref:VWFA domain-containing protein n=1 Tax=Discina gigas TaxID=1032678 RepID=A0ABR3GT18_9PEZI